MNFLKEKDMIFPKTPDEILDTIRKSVVIVFRMNGGPLVSKGSGFLVGVPMEGNPKLFKTYVVTAKHCVQNKKSGGIISSVKICFNKTKGGADIFQISLSSILLHDDPNVDLVAIPYGEHDKLDHITFHSEFIFQQNELDALDLTNNKKLIICGREKQEKCKEYLPDYKYGDIISINNENLIWINNKKEPIETELYTVDADIIGGNSGAPVLFDWRENPHGKNAEEYSRTVGLCGIVSGYDNASATPEIKKGIGMITPGYKLYEILFSKRAIDMRKKHYEKHLADSKN